MNFEEMEKSLKLYTNLCRAIMNAKFENVDMQLLALETTLFRIWDEFGINTYRDVKDEIFKEFNLI